MASEHVHERVFWRTLGEDEHFVHWLCSVCGTQGMQVEGQEVQALEPYVTLKKNELAALEQQLAQARALLELVQKRHDSLFAHDPETLKLVLDIDAFLASEEVTR